MYRPTIRSIKRSYSILNREIFSNKLPKSSELSFQIGKVANCWGYCKKEKDQIIVKLLPEYGNRNFFITILAHEMVHVYEAVYYDKMTHGPTFFAFREDFHKAGLELSGNAGYDEDDFV